MPYIGKQPVVGNFVKLDAITTSATTTFNLLNGGVAYYPQSANNCIVSLNGVIQSPTTDYTISGSTIVFASALTTSDVINFILVLGDVLAIGTPSDGTVGTTSLSSGLTVPTTKGGTGLTTLGTAGQALVVNSGATGLQYSTVGATAGQVIQVVTAIKTSNQSTTSTTAVDISGLSVSITPSSSSNKILIISTVNTGQSLGYYRVHLFLSGGNTASYIGDANSIARRTSLTVTPRNGDGWGQVPATLLYLDSPATTSAITYKVQFSASSGTAYINATGNVDSEVGSPASTLVAMEIKG